MVCVLALTAAFAAAAPTLDARIHAVATLAGQPHLVGAAGLTTSEAPILTLENDDAFDPSAPRRRLVVLGGFGGDAKSALAVVDFAEWFKTRAPSALRREWTLSVLPAAAFDAADTASLERWVTFQAPDLLVEVRDDGRSVGVKVLTSEVVSASGTADAIARRLAASPRTRSALHESIVRRVARDPLTIARLLATRYPETPSISYIPSVAWTSTLRLAALTNEPAIGDKVREQAAPWVGGGRPLFGDRIQLTSVAGAMVFAELGGEALPRALEAAALASARKEGGIAQYGQGWTDDMFMASAILARVGALPGRAADLDAIAQLLADYSARLQRSDGIFVHATDGPFAWGRGNGFAALGLTETLTRLPEQHPARANLLSIYRRQMAALRNYQSPDGAWRQVIDEPGAYREETATAMVTVAMARGLRRGWLDKSYQTVVDKSWRALAAHVNEDGTLIDVCAGTGAGPTRRYYLDRPAVSGADDRGGAMALAAAVEYVELRRLSSRRRAGSSSTEPTAR
jgi:rhamnogalacturonyl hydrolase YesR